ncbi:hypothetical protein CDL15_Pgr019361 [Punica granatum]|uniref:Uncharacterized protein n=1 Tax=Punica granatum TaxID=22663 RepID=A0A218X5G2_PUNGR|nr:hypothetical protein CDL15_Pgr019361 [Punica granatum]
MENGWMLEAEEQRGMAFMEKEPPELRENVRKRGSPRENSNYGQGPVERARGRPVSAEGVEGS